MKNSLTVTVAASIIVLSSGSSALANDITDSEAACLQRQVDIKKAEDLLRVTAEQLADASLYKIPEAKLGAATGEAKKEVATSVRKLRGSLRSACQALYP